MIHVGTGLIKLLGSDQSFYPARIQVDKITGTTSFIGQVFDSQAQSSRPRWADHQPVMIAGKMLVIESLREGGVIDAKIIPSNSLLGHTRSSTRFKNIKRSVGKCLWHPNFIRKVP